MRTNATAVQKIIEVDSAINAGDLSPFIESANALVTEVCVPLGYDDTRLELIERWLSAHFYAVRDPRLASEKAGPVSASYQHELGLMFKSTMYGQQAMLFDSKGGLARLQKQTEMGAVPRGIAYLGTKED